MNKSLVGLIREIVGIPKPHDWLEKFTNFGGFFCAFHVCV